MLPAWRLATSSLLARRSRSVLLIAAVALSAALIAAVSCAMASLTVAVGQRLDETVGKSDLRIKPTGTGGTMSAGVLEAVRAWPETRLAVGRLEDSSSWKMVRPYWKTGEAGLGPQRTFVSIVGTAVAQGIDAAHEGEVRQTRMVEGRLPHANGEVAIDKPLAEYLSRRHERPGAGWEIVSQDKSWKTEVGPDHAADVAEAERLNRQFDVKLGDEIELVRLFKKNVRLRVVGVVAEPPFGGRWRAFLALDQASALSNDAGKLSQVDVVLRDDANPERVAAAHQAEMPKGVVVQTTERVTSGLEQNVRSQDLGFVVATVMAFLAASFIIMTGMSTGVTERQRELSIARCIGATRAQLAWSQLLGGGFIGLAGGLAGVPLGVGLAWVLLWKAREQVPQGLQVSVLGLGVALFGAVMAGLLGAAFPAWRASRVSPLEGLSVRAAPARMRTVALLGVFGLLGLAIDTAIVLGSNNGQFAFWGYATVGLPSMFVGYFLLSVPSLLLVTWVCEPLVRRLMGLPKGFLGRTVRATPYRYGFTAGAMMSGLAIMIAIWTQGHAILNDWLGRFEFPDAFAVGLNFSEESGKRLEALPFVTGTVPITLHNVETEAFGVRALQKYKTTFIAFEPEPFFRLTKLSWVEPKDEKGQARAQARMAEGGAILVAKEFQVAQGLGVGDTFIIKGEDGTPHPMDIVGVVTSPGLEIVSKFFSVGDTFTEQAVHAVFGSRKDLKEKLGNSAINMFQIGLAGWITDDDAVSKIRAELVDSGLLDAGSGRKIKQDIAQVVRGTMLVSSSVAVFAMVISSFGVANVVVAGIQSRQFEFGVLRAVGGSRGFLVRLVLGEAVLIALTAGVLGTLLGLHGVVSGQQLDRMLFGLQLHARPPLLPLAAGWLAVLVVTLGAAGPAVLGLGRKAARELLAAR